MILLYPLFIPCIWRKFPMIQNTGAVLTDP
jgi:hypothetical protein